MATAAFLLAPMQPIPEEADDEWTSLYASWNWFTREKWDEMWAKFPPEDRMRMRRVFDQAGLSSNFMDCDHLDDQDLKKSAFGWVQEQYEKWKDAGYPEPPPSNGPAEFAAATGTESRVALSSMIYYRGGFRAIPKKKLRSGVGMGFLNNKSGINEFALYDESYYEIRVFDEIARAYGGEHLAIWTFGHAIHMRYARSEAPGTLPSVTTLSVRISPPSGGRMPQWLSPLRTAMEDSVFSPDWSAMEAQLAAPRISVVKWFASFGIKGAKELDPPDREAAWAQFDRAATELLQGRPAPKEDLRPFNALLKEYGADETLPGKPPKKRPSLARRVAEIAYTLSGGVGPSQEPRWKERCEVAAHYWDITDCSAGERMTVGRGKKDWGTTVALMRLLTHYPVSWVRDNILMALAAHEAESANGHFFVEPLCEFSAYAHEAGFHLVVFPTAKREKFRKAFGIEQIGDNDPLPNDWSAEAFVDLPESAKTSPGEAIEAWFRKEKADGHLMRAESDGDFKLTAFSKGDGQPDAGKDEAALASAARALDPRAALSALGYADLLEPGEWTPGAYGGGASSGEDEQRVYVREALAVAADAEPQESWSGLVKHFGTLIRYGGDRSKREDGITSFKISIPEADEAYLRELRQDFNGDDMVAGYGDVWIEGNAVIGYTRTNFDVNLTAQVLGDVPPGTRLDLDIGREHRRAFTVG